MNTELESRRFVVVSTGHVSRPTATMLDETPCAKWPCVGGSYADYGWFFYAHDENCGEGDQHIPDDLFAVMTWARAKGFDYVLLDCDADAADDLQTFEW